MAKPYKDSVKRRVGRPSNDELTERQALIKREIINTLKPYYKPAAEQLAKLAGIKVSSKEELVVENSEKGEFDKGDSVSANVRCTAAKTLMDKFEEAIKELYSKEDSTPAKAPPEEEEPKPKPSNVSKLSLTVRSKEE